MLPPLELEGIDDICSLAELLSGQIDRLEQATRKTGTSIIDISTSEHVETTLLNAVAVLRRTRNFLRPVNELPPEILSHIFSFVPASTQGRGSVGWTRDFGPHAIAPVADLLPLLRVCSIWRSVATSSSFLWSTIDNRDHRAFVISSNYRPVCGLLDVHVSGTSLPHGPSGPRQHYELDTNFLDLLRHDGHRVREFLADVSATSLRVLMQFRGENLQTCILSLTESHDMGDLRSDSQLFNGCTPKLKSFIMNNVLIIPSNQFPSLTHLILARGWFSLQEPPYTFSDFLQFLSHCPNLEVLHLFGLDAAKFLNLPDSRAATPVNLQHLRKFSNEEALLDRTMEHPVDYFGPFFRRALLAHLQFSPDCLIRLATILPDDLDRTLQSLPVDKPFTSVYLSGHDGSSSRMNDGNRLERECFSLMATDRDRPRGVRIDFQMPGRRYTTPGPSYVATEAAREVIRDALHAAPLLAGVSELWVMPAANVLLCEPRSLLEAFPDLTTLVLGLSTPVTPPDIMGLQDLDDFDVADHSEPSLFALVAHDDGRAVLCPRLSTLCVYVTTEEHVMLLYSTLVSRDEAGHPVRRLVVGFYQPPEHAMLELAAGLSWLVEDVTLLRPTDPCPDDLLWVHRLPFVCRDSSERHLYWPAWS